MKSDVVLRPAKAADTDALAEIWHVWLCSMAGASESLILSRARCLERLLTEGPGWRIVVADMGNRITRFVAWIAADGPGEGRLRELFVHPAAQAGSAGTPFRKPAARRGKGGDADGIPAAHACGQCRRPPLL